MEVGNDLKYFAYHIMVQYCKQNFCVVYIKSFNFETSVSTFHHFVNFMVYSFDFFMLCQPTRVLYCIFIDLYFIMIFNGRFYYTYMELITCQKYLFKCPRKHYLIKLLYQSNGLAAFSPQHNFPTFRLDVWWPLFFTIII